MSSKITSKNTIKNKQVTKEAILVVLVFLLSIVLRFSLSIINSESNDDHFEVINIIKNEGRFPESDECWECFQPKLFHLFVAKSLNLLPSQSFARQSYLGLRAHLRVCYPGVIVDTRLAAANIHELTVAEELFETVQGRALGDRNYWSPVLADKFRSQRLAWLTPYKSAKRMNLRLIHEKVKIL